jgi:hypothetical protein
MSSFKVAAMLGIALACSLVAGALISGAGRPQGPQGSLAQACAGLGTDRELEDTLADVRGQSNGGSDPLCEQIGSQGATAGPLRDGAIVAAKVPEELKRLPAAHQPMP